MSVRFRRSPIRWGLLPLVVAGGVVGVAARELLMLGSDAPSPAVPLIVAINVAGSGLLGLVVGWVGDRARWRAFLGAGVLGGFTSYSALAPLLASVGTVRLTLGVADVQEVLTLALSALAGVLLLVAAPLVVAALGFSGGAAIARRRENRHRPRRGRATG